MPADPPGALHVLTRPRMLLLHAAGVLAVLAAGWLGAWQAGAWQEHRQDRVAQMARLDPVPIDEVIGADDAFPREGVGRPVGVAGGWLPDATVFVDGRLHGDAVGVWMVTPVSVCGSPSSCGAPAVPVVVGWAPDVAAAPAPPSGPVRLTGWLQPAESQGEVDPDPSDDVLTALRIADLLKRVDRDLYGAYVILDTPAEARADLVPVTPESLPEPPAFTALRNLLYALEWWFFGAFAVFLWVRWCRDEVAAARATARAADEDAAGSAVSRVSSTADGEGEPTAARIPSES